MSDLPISKLRALMWAEIHMKEARDTAMLLLDLRGQLSEQVTFCIQAGILTSYTRSFGANTGMSKLPSNFGKFDDPRMQKFHDYLIKTRDTFYAHKDFKAEIADN